MREYDLVSLISFLDSRLIVDVNLAKVNLITNLSCLGVVASQILRLSIDLNDGILGDDVLNSVQDESIKRCSLLRNKTMLLEVRPDDSPGVLLSDLVLTLLDIHI